ncbi:MAG: chromate transporter [Clostridiales bacterium]|jgi:chromate transporter|nr:chromate transporter [Clostridiales bacterium]
MKIFSIFFIFFRVGLFGFGGGYAILPLIYQGIQELGYMSATEFSRLVAISQVTPGPIAINAATYVGHKYEGLFSAIMATFGVVAPSIILVLIVYHFMSKFKKSETLNGVLKGIRPATIGLLGSAVVFLAQESIFTGYSLNLLPAIFCLVTVFLCGKFRIHPITLTIAAGILGAFIIR